MTPALEDRLERQQGEPEGWHIRETTETGYPLMGSSPAERAEATARIAWIKAEAMRTHTFEGAGPYCEARISTRPQGSPEVGIVTGWVGCGYPADMHPDQAK